MINTLNETALHKTIKNIYAINTEGKTEVKAGTYIADIVTKDDEIIEIQTSSISSLKPKIQHFLKLNKKLTVVFPVPEEKIIETKDSSGIILSKRKSPQKKSEYSVFRELTGIYPYLTDKNFTLILLLCSITEERTSFPDVVQSKNNRRRFKKNWLKTGKRLNVINREIVLKTKSDYKKLLPENLNSFTLKEFICELRSKKKSINVSQGRFFLWIYTKLGIIKLSGKKGKENLYEKK